MRRPYLIPVFTLLFALLLGAVRAQIALPWPGPGTPASSGGGGTTVAFDAVSSNTVSSNTGTTLTWTHTPVGTPTAVAVEVMNYDTGHTVSGVTYGGVALTKAISQAVSTSSVQIWCLPNPPSGAQSVVVTLTATGGFTQGAAITVTGSHTAACFDGTNSSTGTSGTPSTTVTGGGSNDLVVDIIGNNNGQLFTVGAGQTSRFSDLASSANEASGSTQPGGSSVTMSWTLTSSPYAQAVASFQAGP